MYQLSLNNIESIRSDIGKQRVSYSHLLDDLVDHVCCDIEAEMEKGLSFHQAYAKVKERVGANRYKKIQIETLLLIDKNYKLMKKFMKVFGVLSPTLISLAALFKIQHWPGAGIMLTLGFFFLCFFFLPSSIYVLHKENKASKKHLLMYLSGLISPILFLVGILFKVQHWPGASLLLFVGLVLFALVFLPSLVFSKISVDKGEGKKTAYIVGLFAGLFYIAGFLFKLMHWPGASVAILLGLILGVAVFLPAISYANFKDETYIKGRFIFLTVAVMMAAMFISLMSLSVSKNIFNDFVVAETQFDNVLQDLIQKNTSIAKSIVVGDICYESASEIRAKTREIQSWINELKRELIIKTDPANKIAFSGDEIDYSMIDGKDNGNVPLEVLFGEENKGKAFQLKGLLQEYREFLLSISDNPELASSLDMLLDVSRVREIHNQPITWEDLYFSHRTLMSVLSSLTTIQVQLELAEKEIISILAEDEFVRAQNTIAEENSSI
jgi:hypothetical protein